MKQCQFVSCVDTALCCITMTASVYTMSQLYTLITFKLFTLIRSTATGSTTQGCSLGLERLGLEAVSGRFLERLVSVLKI